MSFKESARIILMSIQENHKGAVLNDPSLWLLVFSNLVTAFFAIQQGWSLAGIMFIYWFQSIIIGFFNFVRILRLKEFDTSQVSINGRPATQKDKKFIAYFFLVHYGLFHFGYFFLVLGQDPSILKEKFIYLTAALFFINHLFSYLYNAPRDTKKQNIGNLMFYPYVRILPMHLTAFLGSTLTVFLTLKTFADALMHIIEHRVIRKGEETIS